jgi:hypothetical protein
MDPLQKTLPQPWVFHRECPFPVGRGGLAKPTCPPQAESRLREAGSSCRGFKNLTPTQLKVLIETELP